MLYMFFADVDGGWRGGGGGGRGGGSAGTGGRERGAQAPRRTAPRDPPAARGSPTRADTLHIKHYIIRTLCIYYLLFSALYAK